MRQLLQSVTELMFSLLLKSTIVENSWYCINYFQLFYNWRIKLSKNFPWNHTVSGLVFKNCSGDEIVLTMCFIDNLALSRSFCYKREANKRTWNTSSTWSKFAQIQGIFLRRNYGIRGRRYWKHQQFQARNLYV